MRPAVVFLSLLSLSGCVVNGETAPYSSQISPIPDTLPISWNSDWDGDQDGLGVLAWSDIYVTYADIYQAQNGRDDWPLQGVEVQVLSNFGGIYVIPEEAIQTVAEPEAPDDVNSLSEVREACTDEAGNFDDTEEWCSWWWDAETEKFYEFGGDYTDAGGYSPTYLSTTTNSAGMVRVYFYVDMFPSGQTATIMVPGSGSAEEIAFTDAGGT